MGLFFVKFALYFIFSYFVLCFPISNQTMFSHLHKWTAPHTEKIYQSVVETCQTGLMKGKKFFDKLFADTSSSISDAIESRYSSVNTVNTVNKLKSKKQTKPLHGVYSIEEEEKMLNYLRSSGEYRR